ncbi:glycosyltransferase family 2 protein [cf. Phormidesmis sp. LEGE 11477]|uniref:glycosyltransferase n=1 Tax=cf. Phormidesmis sp. LEGE 11477 TaxID=1828680 RepID=UPI00187E300F|nr:glycosyltransferase family 2 protein [cf. Phormidesmis sp. LEGE 11477]MBE9062319.1 glycosyltransferase family 2 protein [cf. Phormidesmis sp. LEGE 11477]
MLTVTVVVPTYRRPKDLERCLTALKHQNRPADEVVVVARDTDNATWTFLESFDAGALPLKTVTVKIPGVVAAMNAGLDTASSDIVAYTDDDAAPLPDWVEQMEAHFLADEKIGAVGGRDILHGITHIKFIETEQVGQVQWCGRIVGNHSFGIGGAREVDLLKGVNMGFRRVALEKVRFDKRMRGTGAQVFFEDACCLTLKRQGWKIIYNPQILVDHYPAQRHDEDQRRQFASTAHVNQVHNGTLNLLEHFSPLQRAVFLAWGALIGTRGNRGVVQCLRFLPQEGLLSVRKTQASLRGQWEGLQTWWKSSHKTTG